MNVWGAFPEVAAMSKTTRTILLVDDDPAVREVLGIALARRGRRVLDAASGREALARARQCRPDLVLLDIDLPDMDGLQVCRALKTAPETRSVRVIMVTGRAEPRFRRMAREAGADAYCTKPFDLAHLERHIASLLRRGRSSPLA